MGWLKARGQQRTDSTHVLAAIRVLNRLERVAATLRAALNAVATVAPDWLQTVTPLAWYDRYGRRIEDVRLPQNKAEREAYAQMVGEDGFHFLDALEALETPQEARELPILESLRRTWQRHYERTRDEAMTAAGGAKRRVRLKTNQALPPAAEGIESPYDADARYRHKRDTSWTGYMVHVSETCEPTAPHLLTHVHTTSASVHEAQCTTPMQQALLDKELPPREHFAWMRPLSVRSCSSTVATSRASSCAVRRARVKAGRCRSRGPRRSSSSPWTGSSRRYAARRASGARVGRST